MVVTNLYVVCITCLYASLTIIRLMLASCIILHVISECLPVSECPIFDNFTNEIDQLQPGFIHIMNTSGCCPRPSKICDPKICPPAPNCPDYYNVITTMLVDNCCPTYECGIVFLWLFI